MCVAQLDDHYGRRRCNSPARTEYPGEATSLAPVVVLFYRFNSPCPCSGIFYESSRAGTVIDSCVVLNMLRNWRSRQSCGANGIFSRRLDFSAFNSLPRTKLNSYHIKVSVYLYMYIYCI
ncbi:Headcase protein [Cyphomyrmex costatus]|uniref:Headcase protein n=1 Tax=Cyphomyrmex costatus TaxID=456900 RepID=A0A195CXY0_9HYME|nr:Headcase protein [Cyphomyrmex costatus]